METMILYVTVLPSAGDCRFVDKSDIQLATRGLVVSLLTAIE
jgi:hypothetical protein